MTSQFNQQIPNYRLYMFVVFLSNLPTFHVSLQNFFGWNFLRNNYILMFCFVCKFMQIFYISLHMSHEKSDESCMLDYMPFHVLVLSKCFLAEFTYSGMLHSKQTKLLSFVWIFVYLVREGSHKKIQNVNFFQIGVVPKLLLLLSELTKTHSCVK